MPTLAVLLQLGEPSRDLVANELDCVFSEGGNR
jgi:hypothetical protein